MTELITAQTVPNIRADKGNDMTALQKIEADVISQDAGLLAVISRAASDPTVDIDKLERLLAAQERVEANQARRQYIDAKLAMRPFLPEITMKGKITIKKEGRIIQETPFARFEDIHEAITPVLTEHGFDLSFQNSMAPDGKVRVTTILTHRSGHSEDTYFDVPHDSSGSKNAVQAIGSSTSYGKRYGTLSILNIRVCGEDDNASTAVTPKMEANDRVNNPTPAPKKERAAPLDGPYKSKTALWAAARKFSSEVYGCGDSDMLEAFLASDESKAFLAQCERDAPSLLRGSDIEDYTPLDDLIAKMRADFEMIENNPMRAG